MQRVVRFLDARWRGRRPLTIGLASSALVAAIAVVDATLNPQVGMVLAYLAPIAVAAVYAPPRVTRLICVAAALASALAIHLGGVRYDAGWIAVWNVVSRLAVFFLFGELVQALRAMFEREQQLARTDPLTGVLNARGFDERCHDELQRLRRYGHTFSVALLDLDDFKQVNDTRGHAVGDAVLRSVTSSLRGSLRRIDSVARLGGDEFVVLLPGTDADAAAAAVEHMLEAVGAAAGDHEVSASIGVVTVRGGEETVDSLLLLADHLLYEAKGRGKGTITQRVIDDPPTREEDALSPAGGR